jgi:hypothetical protein
MASSDRSAPHLAHLSAIANEVAVATADYASHEQHRGLSDFLARVREALGMGEVLGLQDVANVIAAGIDVSRGAMACGAPDRAVLHRVGSSGGRGSEGHSPECRITHLLELSLRAPAHDQPPPRDDGEYGEGSQEPVNLEPARSGSKRR